jgi:hypothetical protein
MIPPVRHVPHPARRIMLTALQTVPRSGMIVAGLAKLALTLVQLIWFGTALNGTLPALVQIFFVR